MSLTFSNDAAGKMLDALRLEFDSGVTGAKIRIYGGTAPQNCRMAITNQPLLAELTMSKPSSAANSRENKVTLAEITSGNTVAAGTASFFRVVVTNPTEKPLVQGSVSDSSGNGDLKLNSVTIEQNQSVSITGGVFELP
jgi:hypothetical protein